MKTNINKKIYTLDFILDTLDFSDIVKKIEGYNELIETLEIDKRCLISEFDENDIEAKQLIEQISIQQYFIGKNIEILNEALTLKEYGLVYGTSYQGIEIQISLN